MDRWQSLTSLLVCSVYGAALGYMLSRQFRPEDWSAYTIVGLAAGFALSRFQLGRNLLKVLSAIQLVAMILAYREEVRSFSSEGDFLGIANYIVLGVTLPSLVLAFGGFKKSATHEQNLPPGYEHVARFSAPLSAWKKLGLVLLVSVLLVAQMFSAALFYMILILPVLFVCYYAIQLVRTRRSKPPTVARRLTVPSQRERPVQSKSYWTVNPDNGEDSRN